MSRAALRSIIPPLVTGSVAISKPIVANCSHGPRTDLCSIEETTIFFRAELRLGMPNNTVLFASVAPPMKQISDSSQLIVSAIRPLAFATARAASLPKIWELEGFPY